MKNSIFIVDEDGKEIEMRILFTFDAEDKKYLVAHEIDNDEDCYAFIYDDDGNIEPVESEEEFAMIEEVFNSFEGFEDEED